MDPNCLDNHIVALHFDKATTYTLTVNKIGLIHIY